MKDPESTEEKASEVSGRTFRTRFSNSMDRRLYEVRPRKDHRGVDLISDALPFGRLWYDEPNAVTNAIGYPMHGQPFR